MEITLEGVAAIHLVVMVQEARQAEHSRLADRALHRVLSYRAQTVEAEEAAAAIMAAAQVLAATPLQAEVVAVVIIWLRSSIQSP